MKPRSTELIYGLGAEVFLTENHSASSPFRRTQFSVHKDHSGTDSVHVTAKHVQGYRALCKGQKPLPATTLVASEAPPEIVI